MEGILDSGLIFGTMSHAFPGSMPTSHAESDMLDKVTMPIGCCLALFFFFFFFCNPTDSFFIFGL